MCHKQRAVAWAKVDELFKDKEHVCEHTLLRQKSIYVKVLNLVAFRYTCLFKLSDSPDAR